MDYLVLEKTSRNYFYDYVYCPNCEKKVARYNRGNYLYGSPIRECSYCHMKYVDRHFKEIALEGVRYTDKKKVPPAYIAWIIIGLLAVFLGMLITSYHKYDLIVPGGIVIVIYSSRLIHSIIHYKDNQKYILRETAASQKRLSDAKYVHILEQCGYTDVTQKYLGSPDWDEIAKRIEAYKATHDGL